MKKHLFILLAVLFVQASFSQSIVDTNKLWSTVDDAEYLLSGGFRISNYTKFNGNTLINGFNYKKIFNSTDINLTAWNHVGFIREDTSKKVFALDLLGNEGLIYDFGANIGDTIYFNNPFYTSVLLDSFIIVENVYQINYAGALRNAIDVNSDIGVAETWIEGVGNTLGILDGGRGLDGVLGWSVRLLCFYENGSLLYHYAPYSECFYEDLTNIDNNNLSVNLSIYPNPASTYLQVSSEKLKVESVFIYDIYGRTALNNVIASGGVKQSNNLTIDITVLIKGIYFIKIQTSSGSLVKKFVKN